MQSSILLNKPHDRCELTLPWAIIMQVKSGGHTSNPGFSSTEGIHISMSRFITLSHDKDKKQLTVGAGCTFDEIYKFIRPQQYNIVGGGGSVGIAGWIMGGGYSLKTNQHGLGIDNLVQARIVVLREKVEVVTASATSNADLFWAIKVCPMLDLSRQIERLTYCESRVAGITLV